MRKSLPARDGDYVWERETERDGERERKWLCSARVLLSWTDAHWMPLAGPSSGSQEQAALDLGTTRRVSSPTWLRWQPLRLKLISGLPHSLPGPDPLLCEQSHLFLPSEPYCLESRGLRKQFTFLTPPPTPAYCARSQALPRTGAHPHGQKRYLASHPSRGCCAYFAWACDNVFWHFLLLLGFLSEVRPRESRLETCALPLPGLRA